MKNIYTLILTFLFCQVTFGQIEFNISDETANVGEQVEVDVRVSNFTDVASLLFSVNWDADILNYNSITNFTTELANFDISFFGTPEQATIEEGELAVSWSLPNTSNVTISENNHLLFTIVLDVVGEMCEESEVVLSDTPRAIEIADDSGTIYSVTSDDGSVAINGTGCNNTDGIVDFYVSTETGQAGGTVCFEVTVDDFTNISLIQIGASFDPTKLTNVSVENETLDFAISVFDDDDGEFKYLWEDLTAENPSTIPNGGKLFDLCFDIIADSGSQACVEVEDLEDSNPPFFITIVDSDENSLDYTSQAGCVTIQGGVNDVTFYYDDQDIILGSNVCIPIKTRNFNSIQTFQYALEFDDDILTYTGVGFLNSDLPIFENQLSLIGTDNIRIIWNDISGFGIDIDNEETLFEVCFDVAGNCDETTDIDFTGNMVNGGVEITNSDNEVIPFVFESGVLTISCPCDINLIAAQTNNVSCNGGSDGKLTVEADGGNGSYTYTWSNTESGPMISNLSAGSYTVSVTDGEACNTTRSFTITEPDAISVSGSVTDETVDCDGTISVTSSGGTGDYSYAWSDPGSVDSPNRTDLCKGDYTVTVTDENSCTEAATFTVDPKPLQIDDVTINNVSCAGGNDGSIVLDISGGCEPYNISPSIVDLSAGSYTVTITDASTPPNEIVQTYPVTEPDPIVITLVSITNTDQTINGAIDVTVTGGTPDYTYLWTPSGQMTEDLANAPSGDYTLKVTDANGCMVTSEVYSIGSSVIIFEEEITDYNGFGVACNGDCNGIIDGQAVAANGNVTYTLNGDVITLPKSDLCAGDYTLVFTDEEGLTDQIEFSIIEPDVLEVMISDTSDCSNGTDGTATATVIGGVEDYTYTWSGTTETTSSVVNLEPGNITLIVTDANECQFMESFVMDECDSETSTMCYKGSPIITPNSDGANDVFVISCLDNPNNTLTVFDRFGRTVYTQANYDNTWSGIDSNGDELIENGYMWVLELISSEGIQEVYTGTVTILRGEF